MITWEPKPSERKYYRSSVDGQRAYLVKVDGQDALRLDRPMEELIAKLGPDWAPDTQTYPMTPYQAAKVAYVTDLALAQAMGEHVGKHKEWIDLHERERIAFMKDGPEQGNVRDTMFLCVMKVLEELTGGREG